MVEDEGGFVHLAEDKKHLVVNELFVLLQVTVHMLFQLCTNLAKKKKPWRKDSFLLGLWSVFFTQILQLKVLQYVTESLQIYVDSIYTIWPHNPKSIKPVQQLWRH